MGEAKTLIEQVGDRVAPLYMTALERVAVALEQGVCMECRRPCVGGITPADCDKAGCAWDRATPAEQARAAIEAMREPTEAMIRGARDVCICDVPIVQVYGDEGFIWQAMIDAALAEVPA